MTTPAKTTGWSSPTRKPPRPLRYAIPERPVNPRPLPFSPTPAEYPERAWAPDELLRCVIQQEAPQVIRGPELVRKPGQKQGTPAKRKDVQEKIEGPDPV